MGSAPCSRLRYPCPLLIFFGGERHRSCLIAGPVLVFPYGGFKTVPRHTSLTWCRTWHTFVGCRVLRHQGLGLGKPKHPLGRAVSPGVVCFRTATLNDATRSASHVFFFVVCVCILHVCCTKHTCHTHARLLVYLWCNTNLLSQVSMIDR